MGLTQRDIDRFWIKVEKSGDCWEWTSARNYKGYGWFWLNGKPHKAHRMSFYIAYGFLPEIVMHKCDVTSCVNPLHLLPGTAKKNAHDMIMKGRQGNQKLSARQVRRIRTEPGAQKEIAAKYGVERSYIGQIKRRDAWSWLA